MMSDGSATLLPEPLEVISEAADAAAEVVQALTRSRSRALAAARAPGARARESEISQGHKRREPSGAKR